MKCLYFFHTTCYNRIYKLVTGAKCNCSNRAVYSLIITSDNAFINSHMKDNKYIDLSSLTSLELVYFKSIITTNLLINEDESI